MEREEQPKSVLEQARDALRRADPERVAALSGTHIERRGDVAILSVPLLDHVLVLTHPGLEVARADGRAHAGWQAHLLTYYLSRADGTPEAGTWVALRDLPDGMFYQTAYEGYSGGDLVRAFENDVQSFGAACRALGGEVLDIGDAGYRFRVLPRVLLAAIYWSGEEGIRPSARVLFDASIRQYLPTDSCAALGGWLAGRIIRAHRQGRAPEP